MAAGALDAWPALTLWREDYLVHAAGQLPVTVAITPGGRADAITDVQAGMQPHLPFIPPENLHPLAAAATASANPTGQKLSDRNKGHNGSASASGSGSVPSSSCQPEAARGSGSNLASKQHWFLTPHEQRMSLAQFFALVRETRKQGSSYAPYVQVRHYTACCTWNTCYAHGMHADGSEAGTLTYDPS